MKSWHGFGISLALCCYFCNWEISVCEEELRFVVFPLLSIHVLERRIGHSSSCREGGREGMREGGEQIWRRGEGGKGERGRGGEMAGGEGGREGGEGEGRGEGGSGCEWRERE